MDAVAKYQAIMMFLAGGTTLALFVKAVWAQVKDRVFAVLEGMAQGQRNEELRYWTTVFVRAAEQACGAQPVDDKAAAARLGSQKYNFVKAALVQKGLEVVPDLIEAAVHEVKRSGATPAEVIREELGLVRLAEVRSGTDAPTKAVIVAAAVTEEIAFVKRVHGGTERAHQVRVVTGRLRKRGIDPEDPVVVAMIESGV